MKLKNVLLKFVLIICAIFFVLHAHADDQQDINGLIQNLYREEAKSLLCANQNGDQDKLLIKVSERYLSTRFMNYFKQVCLEHPSVWLKDIRTGEYGLFSYPDSEAGFTNLKIAPPKIKGTHANIRTTYDLPVASYEQFKNFTLFSLIKENGQWKIDDIELGGQDFDKYNQREPMTGLQAIKSLKKYIKKGLAEHEAEKKPPE